MGSLKALEILQVPIHIAILIELLLYLKATADSALFVTKPRQLEGNQLEGPIPDSLGQLPQLHEVYVSKFCSNDKRNLIT